MALSDLVRKELLRDAVNRKLVAEFSSWTQSKEKEQGFAPTANQKETYWRERLIDELVKQQRKP